jgi:hypothetical protein
MDGMERRSEPRVEANAPVIVTELGSQGRHPMGGMAQDISGCGMRLKLPQAIACGAPVRVETKDMLLLGEVVRCEPDGEGFRIGLTIHHSLKDLQELDSLCRSLLANDQAGMGEERAGAEIKSTIRMPAPTRWPL